MRKASRLFEIIQILRLATGPVTAAEIGARLGVTARSIYRDIVELQAMAVPVEGGRGIGYILRPGFELPPLMFSIEETEAIVLALALLRRTGDRGLDAAAGRINRKIAAAMPAPLRPHLASTALHAWGSVVAPAAGIDTALVRQAIRDERKLTIDYADAAGLASRRTIRPVALIYYSSAHNIVAWCELRQAIRHFRTDRVTASRLEEAHFRGEGESLRRIWIAGWTQADAEPPQV
ncbi:putative DNA-binding transcriptional regulator YafY [Hoeflea marina]|uniref:Putative DNA-binding transcriptional regulator YafY n=1 Tax=Hoeflea marina TaxID=274592 RepID=A0A317PPD4_9HYPH|nr:YafY family protein [Hoeflea marina]PWW03368.1 putative DNA-binding transcriptional regulator YafY [Hoeflea marina]